jgi:hypothetical protein
MCPVCISSMAFVVAGATSIGTVGTFVARSFARIARVGKAQLPESKETIRHDYESDRAPESRIAD